MISPIIRRSQLYHIDYYSHPNVYVIVLLRDATPEHGPWTFLPRSASQKAAKAMGYWGRRRGYRVSDQEVYSAADRKDVLEFCRSEEHTSELQSLRHLVC